MAVEASYAESEAHPGATWRGHVLSGWWRRALAFIVDLALISVAPTAVLWVAGFDFGEYYDETSSFAALRAVDIVNTLVYAAGAAAYYVPLMLRWNGQTVGKRLTRIRAIRADEQPMDVRTILLRQVLVQNVALGLVPIFGVVNYLSPVPDRENRAVHDFIARTRVIRVRSGTTIT